MTFVPNHPLVRRMQFSMLVFIPILFFVLVFLVTIGIGGMTAYLVGTISSAILTILVSPKITFSD